MFLLHKFARTEKSDFSAFPIQKMSKVALKPLRRREK